MRSYSSLLHTVYDQPEPVGKLGRGTHYSVLSFLNWFDQEGALADSSKETQFAVIWDEDHDVRIAQVLENAVESKILQNALFIGERKGLLSVLLRPGITPKRKADLEKAYYEIAQSQEDAWGSEIAVYPGGLRSLINESEDQVKAYLEHIRVLWPLNRI